MGWGQCLTLNLLSLLLLMDASSSIVLVGEEERGKGRDVAFFNRSASSLLLGWLLFPPIVLGLGGTGVASTWPPGKGLILMLLTSLSIPLPYLAASTS